MKLSARQHHLREFHTAVCQKTHDLFFVWGVVSKGESRWYHYGFFNGFEESDISPPVGWRKMSVYTKVTTKNPRWPQHEFEKILGALGGPSVYRNVETGGLCTLFLTVTFFFSKCWKIREDGERPQIVQHHTLFWDYDRSLRIRRRRWWWLRYMKLKILAMMADIGFQSKLLGKCNRDQHWIWFYAVEHGPRSCTY